MTAIKTSFSSRIRYLLKPLVRAIKEHTLTTSCSVQVTYPSGQFNMWLKPHFLTCFLVAIVVHLATCKGELRENCRGELGCFSLDPPFGVTLQRPLALAPLSREKINTTFRLLTPENPKEEQILKANDLKRLWQSFFSEHRRTKFIVHGLMEYAAGDVKWITDLAQLLLLEGDYNVIIVDWRGGNQAPYARAASNTRVVGAEIALLVKFLQEEKDVNASDVHIIGHSLGAQVAGYAGQRIPGLGRITGLDPAGPYYQGTPPEVRLDPTDATLVDVIHTNIESEVLFGLGVIDPCGHFDFYPNGAKTHPGCSRFAAQNLLLSIPDYLRKFMSCEHQRSVDFFMSTLGKYRCKLVGYPCPSYDDFLKGRCGACGRNQRNCPVMGIEADDWEKFKVPNRSLVMFLKTYKDEPFCMPYYAIVLNLDGPVQKDVGGDFHLTLISASGIADLKLPQSEDDVRANNVHGFMIDGQNLIGEITSITIRWNARKTSWMGGMFGKKPVTPRLQSVEIKQMHMSDSKSVTRFCTADKKELMTDGTSILLTKKCIPVYF